MEDVLKQAKLKALSLLTDMDRTEAQLRQKLKQKAFEENIIEQTIEYVKSFGYIDDAKYAQRFVESRKKTKSKQEITAMLKEKGVSRVAMAGGVASNSTLRAEMAAQCEKNGFFLNVPDPILCTDNAAMIGSAAYYEYIKGVRDGLDLNANPNLKLGER